MKWIADGIAYISFNQLRGEPESIAAVEKFMRAHIEADAIIVDTRDMARGGGASEMNIIFSYLFAEEALLAEIETAKADGAPLPPRNPTMREVAAPANMTRLQHWALPRKNRAAPQRRGSVLPHLAAH